MAMHAWRFVSRELAKSKRAKDLKDAFREVDDAARSAGTAAKRSAREVAAEVDDELGHYFKTGARRTMKVLDAANEYGGKPLFGVTTGRLGAKEQQYTDAEGNTVDYRAGDPTWGDFGRGIKKLVTQDPRDTYGESRQAFDEGQRDPNLSAFKRIATGTLSDPTLYVSPGAVAKVLPAGIRATRGARVAGELIETPRRVAAGAAAGSAAGQYVAEKTGAPEWVGTVAGGLVGGGIAARRPTARGGESVRKMVDYQHPDAEAYGKTLDRHGIDWSYDENGVIVPDSEALDRVMMDLETRAQVSLEPRGVYDKKSPYVEVGGKQVRRSRKRVSTEEPDPDLEAVADLQRLRELTSDDTPPAGVEATRMDRVKAEVDDALPKPKELTERQKKLRATAAAKEEAANLPFGTPRMMKDGAYTWVIKTDRTRERFYTAGKRGAGGLEKARDLYAAEDAKFVKLKAEHDAAKAKPTETVKRTDLFGNVTDTFQTEAELQGIRAEQGGLDLEGKKAAWDERQAKDATDRQRVQDLLGEMRGPKDSNFEPETLIEAPTVKADLNRQPESGNQPGFGGARGSSIPNSGGQGQFGVEPKVRPGGADAEFGKPANDLIPTTQDSLTVPPEGIGPGNPQPSLGQEGTGADLLQLPDRQRAIAGESAFMASRAGKIDTKMRESTARILGPLLNRGGVGERASNITRDAQITPIFRGINQAENQRAHLKSLIEDKLHALIGSGIRLEQNADGNWVEANSGLMWSDIVEQDSAAGKAAWEALTDDQRRITTELTDLQVRATETSQRYGADQALLTHEGEHWPRRVASIAGEDKARGMTSSSRVGATRSTNKARSVGTAGEGAQRQIVYEHPFDAFVSAFDDKLKNGTDAWVESMVKPLGKTGNGFTTLNVPGHPGLAGLQLEPEAANRINAGLSGKQFGVIEGAARGINSVLTPVRASLDFSATFQQGMKMWLTSPKAAAKHWATTLASLKNPDKYFEARSAIDSDVTRILADAGVEAPGGIEYLITNGLRQTAKDAEHEFALPRITGKLETAAKPYNKVAGKAQDHFDRLLNLYRLEGGRDVLQRLVDEGKRGADLEDALRRGTRAVNRAFGWSENKPSNIEAIGMFAPRFFRSNIESIYKAVTDRTIEGDIARQHLVRMAGMGVALTVAANEARGYETEFKPWDSNFMRIRNVGGVDVSVYGPYDTLVRYLAATATGDPGAIGKLAESKASPVVGQVLAQVKGKTYLGEPLDSNTKRVTEALKNILPFPVQNLVEQGIEEKSPKDALTSGVVSAFGLKNNPTTPAERAKFLQAGHSGLTGAVKVAGEAQNRFGKAYDELTGSEKAQVNEKPEIKRALENADRRATKGDSDRAARARIQQTARDEIEASAKFLAAGVDDAGNRYSAQDFRLAYNDTQMRAAGARDQIARGAGGDVNGWFALYDQAKMANGQPDYDKLERLQAEYRASHPDIDEKVDKIVGIRDNAAVRELRAARKDASAYYAIPRYRGLTLEEGDKASEVMRIASDMVKFGEARNRGDAFRQLKEQGLEADVKLAQTALRRKANPEREAFRKSHPLFAKFYSEAGAASHGARS